MRNPLRRYYGRAHLHFITFGCYRRQLFLANSGARSGFVQILDEVRFPAQIQTLGYVVMPEHVRLIISEPEHSTPSKVLQVPRPEVSRALRKRRKKSSPRLELAFVTPLGVRQLSGNVVLRFQRLE